MYALDYVHKHQLYFTLMKPHKYIMRYSRNKLLKYKEKSKDINKIYHSFADPFNEHFNNMFYNNVNLQDRQESGEED